MHSFSIIGLSTCLSADLSIGTRCTHTGKKIHKCVCTWSWWKYTFSPTGLGSVTTLSSQEELLTKRSLP